MKIFEEISNKFIPGEIVLVEEKSLINPVDIFLSIINWAKKNEYRILIVDLYNKIDLYLKLMKLHNLPIKSIFEGITVVEIGVRKKYYEIEISKLIDVEGELASLTLEYRKIYEEIVSKQFTVIILLGIDKFLLFRDSASTFIDILKEFLGDKRRIAFYLVNVDVLKCISPDPTPLLEEIATTIIEFKSEDEFIFKKLFKK